MRIEDLSEAKGTKAEAGYQPNPKNGQKCINCTMWRDPNKCTAVAGNIKPEGWCKWYAGGAYGKRGKQVKENIDNWRENIGTNDIVKIEDRYFVVDSFSRSRYGSGLFFRRIDSVIYHKQIDEYQFFGPKTGFYTFNEFNKDKSIEFVMKSSDPKYQEFLLNQDRLKIKENVFFKEDGRIVKGVNTTVDVGPEEIKTQSAKFGNRVDRDGFPPFLRTDGKVTEEKYSLREWAAMQGGHSLEDEPVKRKPFDWNKY